MYVYVCMRVCVYIPHRASQLREMQRGVTFNCTCMPQHAHLYSSAIAAAGPRCERASERATSPIIGECSFLVVIIRVIDSVGAIALRTMRLELTLTAHVVTAGRIWGPDPASRSGNQLSLRFLVRLSAWASHAADMQNLLAGIRIQSRPRNASYYRSIDRSADSAWQGP